MGMPWRRLKWFFLDCCMSCWMGQKVTCVPWILSVCLSIFLHGFQPNNSPAWLHHRLDMSPFLFVSFVTRRSACKVECNSLLSLSSQASYSQTDASNRRAGDEGQSCTPRGEDGSLAAASAHGREDPPHAAAPDRPPPPKDCVLPTVVQLTFCSKFCSS